jgi:hypothetical protein
VVTALAALPPLTDVVGTPLQPSAWCVSVPLWGNPLLPNAGPAGRRPGLEAYHPALTAYHRLLTLGDAVRAVDAFALHEALRSRQLAAQLDGIPLVRSLDSQWCSLAQGHLGVCAVRPQHRRNLTAALRSLLADIEPTWIAAARAALAAQRRSTQPPPPPLPSVDAVVAMIMPRLGWRLSPTETVTLATYSVSAGTRLQLREVEAARSVCHAAYVREALGVPPQLPPPMVLPPAEATGLVDLQSTFQRMWRNLRWENLNKEIFWRLTVDGVPMFGNCHIRNRPAEPCVCGAFPHGPGPPSSPRMHHFWACTVAQEVVRVLESRCQCSVLRQHLWLACPPASHVQQCVWDVVVLAALSAIEAGRRYLHANHASDPAAVCARAKVKAVADFWSRLQDFASLGLPRKGWSGVGSAHPLLRVVGGELVCVGQPAP